MKMGIFKKKFSPPNVEKLKEKKETEMEHSFRWYFLSAGRAMGQRIFESLCGDEEFLNVPPGEAVPQDKVMVRYYSAQPGTVKNRAQDFKLAFQGYGFPLSSSKPAEEISNLTTAFSMLFGEGDLPEVPVMVVLTDSRFDKVMRGYCHLLNIRYIKSGGLPIVQLVYTDDIRSAQNLTSLFSLRTSVDHFEEKFKNWCISHRIDPDGFDQISKQIESKKAVDEITSVSFEDIDSFRKLLLEHYNLCSKTSSGIIEPNTLVEVLRAVDEHVSVYLSVGESFAIRSVFRIAVFPKDKYPNSGSESIEFFGLGLFSLDPWAYMKEIDLTEGEIGLVNGRIMSRLHFESWSRLTDSLESYKPISIDNLEQRISERQVNLGLK